MNMTRIMAIHPMVMMMLMMQLMMIMKMMLMFKVLLTTRIIMTMRIMMMMTMLIIEMLMMKGMYKKTIKKRMMKTVSPSRPVQSKRSAS